MEYGTGAIMAVPAHDERDFAFARAHDLPIRPVILPAGIEGVDPDAMKEAFVAEGVMVNSGPFDGEASPASISKVTAWLDEQDRGRASVTYRLRDWLISRQRYWGAPIPIIHCEDCGEVAVPEDQLPVLLPDDVDFRPGGESPLAGNRAFVDVECPSCGKPARRETDTMDTFVDSSWYFFRYCSPHESTAAFDPAAVAAWMPVAQYTGGVEHATLHLMYSRFFTKVLNDMGLISFSEPFPKLMNQGQVIYGGAAMSKSKGNIVEPMPLVERWGADTMRLTMLFAGPFEDDIDWKLIAPDPGRRPAMNAWLGRVFKAAEDAAGAGSSDFSAANFSGSAGVASEVCAVGASVSGIATAAVMSGAFSATGGSTRSRASVGGSLCWTNTGSGGTRRDGMLANCSWAARNSAATMPSSSSL
jgi:leucyl-tRNA synthetase